MKHFLMAFPILALSLVCVTFSQDKAIPAQSGGDSMHQMMPAHERMAKEAWGRMGDRHGMMGWWHGMQGMREGQMRFQHNFRQHLFSIVGCFLDSCLQWCW